MKSSEKLSRRNSSQFAMVCEAALQRGLQVRFLAEGRSMQPNILDGDTVVAAPITAGELQRGDIALTRGGNGFLLHRVIGVDAATNRIVTRGDAGQRNDTPVEMVLAKVVGIERNGKSISFTTPGTTLIHAARKQAHRLINAGARRIREVRSSVAITSFLLLGVLLHATPAVAQNADLQTTVDSAAAPTTIAPGGQITYTITVVNNGPNTAATPSVTDTTPANTTFVSMGQTSGGGTWNCTNPGVGSTGLSTCTRTNNMGNGSTTTFTYVVQINPGTTAGTTITNSATIGSTTNDPIPGNNTLASNIVTVGATPDLSVTMTAAPNPVATGGNITYSQTVTNNSATVAAIGATLTQATPANTTFQSVTVPAGWTCGTVPAVGGTGAILCAATGTMAAASSANFTVVVTVVPGAPGGSTITNSVTVSETGTDPNTGNNTATASVTVSGADLSMTQVASAPAVAAGLTITYTEAVTNNGPNAAVGAVLYQQTPPNTTFASIMPPAGWTCTAPGVGATGSVICSASANVSSGTTSGNFSFVVTIAAATAAGTSIVNSADVTSQTTDPVSSNNTTATSVLVEITGDADLAVSMVAAPTPVFVSSSLAYTIQVTNLGLATAAGVTVVDTLPATLTGASATTTQGSCGTVTAGTITCTLGTVAYPLATPITITVTGATPSTATTLTNKATVSTTSTDPVTTNNSVTVLTVVQPLVCATPGKDGAGGTLGGVVNTYYAPSTGTLAAGATSVTLGAAAAAPAAQTAIGVGDLLLIIQMQGAQINSTNSSAYGSGVPGDPSSGSTNLGSSGQFEFVTATVAVPITGGTLTFTGTGAGGGLLNTYTNAAATATQGIQTFQVIRVPQYTSATFSNTLTALPWNGAVGGVMALDIASQLTLGGTVSLDGEGFRGGGGRILGGAAGTLATDVVTSSTLTTNGSKGEGIGGTPHFIAPALSTITPATTAVSTGQAVLEGLPNGSYARGAPANAGGGSTDANPTANDQNSGGGAGGNGGTGGTGGFGWNSAGIVGGFGGTIFPASTSALVMGGGGGAGTTNNGSFWTPSTNTGNADCGANCNGIFSSGSAGGGIVIVHTGSITGTGTITANGVGALQTENDGGGGGGAGGSILVFTNSGSLSGLTASAVGGSGGITWPEQGPGAFPGNRHGPGGGGGGGVIFASAAPGSSNVSGGIPGWSTLANDPYGASPGQAGVVSSGVSITQTPGTQSGAYCAGADLAVTNSGTPSVVVPGNAITYTQTVTNNGPLDAVNATFTETVPANTTFTSLAAPVGWACTTPAVGATGSITCTNPDVASAAVGTFTLKVTVNAATTNGTQIVDTANITSGTNDPILTNNSATVLTIVGLATTANIAVAKTASPNPVLAGSAITYSIVVKNNGPAAAANVKLTDAIPANTTFSTLAQTGTVWTCPAVTTTVQCTLASFPSGATTTFTLTVTVGAGTASGTKISNTASTSSTTTDSNPGSNSSTAIVTVATAGQFDLIDTTTASPNPVSVGNNITFLQTLTNAGPGSPVNVVFTGSVPANTTFVSLAIPTGLTCPTLPAVGGTGAISCCPGSAGVCTAGFAAPPGSVQLPLIVKVKAGTPSGTIITNTSSIAPTVNDVNPANNTSSASVVVGSPTQSDVAIVKTAAPEPVDQGTTLTYTLQVTNNGPAVAQGVAVFDPLPTQVTFVSVSTTQGTCSQAAGVVTCSIGTMSVGGLAIITINTTATTFSSATTANNTATVTSTTSDPNLANNFSSTISNIQAPTAVQLASFRAQNLTGGGVALEWSTREEIRNLGFHVYREDAQGRHQLNPSIIAGGALFLRGGQPQHAAKTYRWIDPQGTAQSSYILEDVDLNGTRTTHGPVGADSNAQEPGPIVPAALLSHMNKLVASANLTTIPAHPVNTTRPANTLNTPEVSGMFLDEKVAAKISIRTEGWYAVTGAQLAAAGFAAGSTRNLQLYAEGVEQPISINSKQNNGNLGPNDSISFYGTGIDTPFSDTRVYWLINGSPAAKRIPSSSNGTETPNTTSFADEVVLQQRTTYFAALLNGIDNDNFFGAVVNSESVDQALTISHLDATSSLPVELDVTLQGVTDGQPHSVSVVLNGTSLGSMSFSNQSNSASTFSVPAGAIQNGTNIVTLAALDGDNDISLVQSIVLHYPHTYAVDSNWLRASAAPGSHVQFTGFSNSQIQVFDITNPVAIEQLVGPVTTQNDGSAITVSVPGAGSAAPHTLLAFSADQITLPAGISFHAASSLLQQRQGAEITIITAPDFQTTLAPLIALRKSQGRDVAVVTTDQLYDAYNYGERTPFALRAYLQAASKAFNGKPKALLLLGEATFDPRNYLGFGDFDLVPTRLIETAAFKTASDDWFSDFAETGFATIPTGRIPARTASDANLVVGKIVSYENGSTAGTWTHQALVVADQNVGVNFSTEAVSASLTLPASLTTTKILADGQDPAATSQQIISAINAGTLLVNYTGHGAEQQWSFADLLDNTSATALTNGNRLPIFLLMDCLNGFFHDVYAESLSSALLFAPNGGAVGVWASSGFTTAPPQASMDQALLNTLAANPSQTIGQAITTAKSGILDPDVRRTWIFFGDPAMRIAFPNTTSTTAPHRHGEASPR